MEHFNTPEEALKKLFGYESFREGQLGSAERKFLLVVLLKRDREWAVLRKKNLLVLP